MALADTAAALAPSRPDRLARLSAEPFDLLVVGGGITGAGVARDAALRGLRVALVDMGDWANGTSSRSSKLVHGGLRYLEHFQLGLVLESTRERAVQRKLNPHLVWPVPFLFPVYRRDRHGLFKITLGLWLYELLARLRSHRRPRRLGPAATLGRAPGLRADGLTGAVFYYDCGTDDARLTLANVLDAERHGATAVSYVRYEGPVLRGDQVVGARLVDLRGGAALTVACRHIVYAAGPWTDGLPDAPGDGALLRPTKGVHVVVARRRLAVDVVVVMAGVADGRGLFAIPLGDSTYIGTTDTDYQGAPEDVHATADDVAYLLDTTNHYFPEAGLTAADVTSTWAGLRPLIRDAAASASRVSREHEILDDPRGITAVAGGKLTTYRAMAAEVLDRALVRLAAVEGAAAAGPCRTHRVPLDPALPRFGSADAPPAEPLDALLWGLHGSAMGWVRERMAARPAEAAPLANGLDFRLAQVSWAVLGEHAERLQDVLIRRLQVFYRAPDQGLACAPAVAAHMAGLLGRDEAWIAQEIADYAGLVAASRPGGEPGAGAPT